MKKRFFALFLTMALLLPAVLLSGCASADSGIMDTANLNATAAGRTLEPIPQGQDVLIVIGEGLDRARIETQLHR